MKTNNIRILTNQAAYGIVSVQLQMELNLYDNHFLKLHRDRAQRMIDVSRGIQELINILVDEL